MLFLPLRYLTLVPATLIIYAGTLFNVINVSACSTNTDNFLSLRTPQHLHRKAEDSYEIPLLAEVVAGLFHLPMYSGDSEWTGTTAAARWWVRNSGLFHSLLLTPGFTFSAGQGENSKVGPRKIVLSFFNAKLVILSPAIRIPKAENLLKLSLNCWNKMATNWFVLV